MKKVFIHSASSISAQESFLSENFLENPTELPKKTVNARCPDFSEFIAPIAARRMATAVKMGVTTAKQALQDAGLTEPDAIITGTGMGCIEDTEKFLNAIISNKEAFLTPTAFIQSTHNTVAAQIALGLKCKSYNNTYVHASISFESALFDAVLMLKQKEAVHVLVGGVDELGTEIVNYVRMMEDMGTSGVKVPFGEGASFFVLSSEDKEHAVELMDVAVMSVASKEKVVDKLEDFLKQNYLKVADIDGLVLGNNGDVFDAYYDAVSKPFKNASIINYKQLSGEFYTASAFGFWLATNILTTQTIPKAVLKNDIQPEKIQNLLLYNQFKGRDHSFIFLKA